jgi:RNA polymerase sigma-70 factor (ECF subfamily)
MTDAAPVATTLKSDVDLIALMLEGDQQATVTFSKRHVPRLYQMLRSFGYSKEESKSIGESSVQYLLEVARARAITNEDDGGVLFAIAREHARRTRNAQQVDAGVIARTLEHLAPAERRIAERLMHGRTRADIAAELGVSEAEVGAAVRAATARLREANDRASTPRAEQDAELEQLVEAARNGDRAAFQKLVEQTTPLVRRAVGSLVRPDYVDDVVQNVYLKLYEQLGHYQVQVGSRFQAWLAVVARRTALDFLRRERRAMQTVSLDSEAGQTALEEAVDSGAMLDKDVTSAIQDVLTHLSERERQMVVMHYMAGQSYAEIAQATGTSPNTVRTLLARARSKIRKAVEEWGHDL